MKVTRACTMPMCGLEARRRGLCNKHYMRWYRHQDPHFKSIPADPWERFLTHVFIQEDGCWMWTAYKDRNGYGKFGKTYAHIFSYTEKYGPVPKGKVLDHFVCDTPSCVNPDHVHPETSRNNTLRSTKSPSGVNSRKTHCLRGHEFNSTNTWTYTTKSGIRRVCKLCYKERAKLAIGTS